MWGYVGRRLLAFIPTVFVAVTLIFILTRPVPGNPVWALLGHQSVSAEQIDAVAREMGLDRPILIRYLNWLPKVLSGNFGQSIFYEQPVAVVIAERFPVNKLLPMSRAHPFGTDELGRDVLTRVIHGSRISLCVGALATLFAAVSGGVLGLIPRASAAPRCGGAGPWSR